VGQQVTLTSTNSAVAGPRIDLLIQRAGTAFTSKVLGGAVTECDLIVKGTLAGEARGWRRTPAGMFQSDKVAEALIDDATLRAPLEGILLTPRLAERAGELLEVGSVFCTLADIDPLRVEIAVREIDADVLVGNSGGHEGGVPQREGRPLEAAVKFSAFPESYYRAKIVGVRTAVETLHGERVLVAEGEVTGSPVSLERLRPGMTGDARILCGSRPLISVLLRRPYRFLRSLIWL